MSEDLAGEAAEFLAAPNTCPVCGAPMAGDILCSDDQAVARLLEVEELAEEIPAGQDASRRELVRDWLARGTL